MAGSPERLKPRHIAVQGLRILLLRVVDELREIITAALSISQGSEQDVLLWRRQMTNQSLRERFGLSEGSSNTVSQIITATIEQGLVKNDPNAPGSRRYARYIPAWA